MLPAAVLALCFSTQAFAQAPAPLEQFTLANGLTVLVKSDPRAPTVAPMLLVRVGSLAELAGT